MPEVVVNHEYTPYKVNAHFVRGYLCSIRLRNRCLRVVHIPSGLAIKAFKNAQDAKALILRVSRDEECNRAMGKLRWSDYRNRTDLMIQIIDCIETKTYNLEIATGALATSRYYKKAKIL